MNMKVKKKKKLGYLMLLTSINPSMNNEEVFDVPMSSAVTYLLLLSRKSL